MTVRSPVNALAHSATPLPAARDIFKVQTCAPLMHGWVALAGCPPNKNPVYAGRVPPLVFCVQLVRQLVSSASDKEESDHQVEWHAGVTV